jgi:general secretion pathway protein I
MIISMQKNEGFTLFEVIVAVAILGISLVMVMQLFSAGLRSARTSCDYTRAIVHAKDKMEELSATLVNDSGEFDDGFRWESEVHDYKEPEETDYHLLKLVVKIHWPDALQRQKAYELVSLKVAASEEEL